MRLSALPSLGLLLCVAVLRCAAAKVVTPHFKWGQTKDQLFISVMVKDLAPDTVSVQLSDDGDLNFKGASKGGEQHALELPLREDVKKESLSYETVARPDKWGIATLITIGKEHAHRWDLLTSEVKKFKGLIDKDWTREDQSLEPADEKVTLDDAENVLALEEKTFNKTISKHPCTVVAVRFPWCNDCKAGDDTFVKAAALAKARGRKKQSQEWKKVAFAYVDARSNKKLGKRLGAACTYQCEYLIFSGAPDEAPAKLKFQYEEGKLLDEVAKFLRPAVVEVTSDEEVTKLKAANVTAVGYFKSQEDKEYRLFKGVANQMRGELVFAARFGEARRGPGIPWPETRSPRNHVQLFTRSSAEPHMLKAEEYGANQTILEMWLRRRSVPLLPDYDWQLRDTYEKLQVPIARLWYDDKTPDVELQSKVTATVEAVAKKMLGKLAFVRQKSSTYSYELRDYGLTHPEEYPCFGIAENASWNSRKFGFDVTSMAPTSKDFWSDSAKSAAKLLEFCENVVAGSQEESHESGPVHANWTKGEVKRIVWKSFHEELKRPKTDLILEVFGKYRNENEVKLKEAENLAKLLEPYASKLTVASYDTSDSYLPPDEFPRDRYAAHSEWYWVPANGEAPKKLAKPKKDPPMKKVLQFLTSQAPDLGITAEELLRKWEEAMKENPPPEPKSFDASSLGDEPAMPDADMNLDEHAVEL